MGDELVDDPAGDPVARPRPHPYDCAQIARQAALPIGRRVELALAWNDFARDISRGRHAPTPPPHGDHPGPPSQEITRDQPPRPRTERDSPGYDVDR